MPQKKPFITLAQAKEIAADIPTPFHLYDEKGIREMPAGSTLRSAGTRASRNTLPSRPRPTPTC